MTEAVTIGEAVSEVVVKLAAKRLDLLNPAVLSNKQRRAVLHALVKLAEKQRDRRKS